MGLEIFPFEVPLWYCGGIDDECVAAVEALGGDAVGCLFEMQAGALGDESCGELAGGAVVAGYEFSFAQEVRARYA